jgi:hypothetical protein
MPAIDLVETVVQVSYTSEIDPLRVEIEPARLDKQVTSSLELFNRLRQQSWPISNSPRGTAADGIGLNVSSSK